MDSRNRVVVLVIGLGLAALAASRAEPGCRAAGATLPAAQQMQGRQAIDAWWRMLADDACAPARRAS